jgi:hypothetical protein
MLWAPMDLGLWGTDSWVYRARPDFVTHSNKWYWSLWSEKSKKSQGSHDDGELVNVSKVTRVVCDMSVGLNLMCDGRDC